MRNQTPIVVVAYNRKRSLSRLLSSLKRANYPNSNIELIISIDFADNNNHVLEMANDFSWEHGKKTVVYHEENLGLRKHIIKCGNLSQEYGSVIILEDDLLVSPNFYNYTISALKFCESDDKIGGISLYNHQLNVHDGQNFSALEDSFDNWYFQFASSWGQAWSANQWKGFKEWYDLGHNLDNNVEVPSYVRRWSEKSWLKYYIAYLVSTDKFFFYPKISLSTNFSDAGTHVGNDSTKFQVPVLCSIKKDYNFSTLDESISVYDAFFENALLHQQFNLTKEDITIDLYGNKKIHHKYLLTSKVLNHKIIESFSKSIKPMDANIFFKIPGNELFLYDTESDAKNIYKKDATRAIIYNHKYISPKNALQVVWNYSRHLIRKVFSLFKIK
ncbi:MAG: glycosyltransferase [Flagellimonas sp.]